MSHKSQILIFDVIWCYAKASQIQTQVLASRKVASSEECVFSSPTMKYNHRVKTSFSSSDP